MINQDCVNARLIRFEHGSISDLPVDCHYSTTYYFALVFIKGGREIKETLPSRVESNWFDSSYLKYIGKIVERRIEEPKQLTYYFTDGTWISMS